MSSRSLGAALTPSTTLTATYEIRVTTTATIGPSAPSPKTIAQTSANTRPGVVRVSITQSPRNASHQRLRPIAIPIAVPSTNATAKPIAMFFVRGREVRESWSEVMIRHISSAIAAGGGTMKSSPGRST